MTENRKADYSNWIPDSMIYVMAAGTAAFAAAALVSGRVLKNRKPLLRTCVKTGLALGAAGFGAFGLWCVYAKNQFSYDGTRRLSKQIIEGTAGYISGIPEGGKILDVGCGSGALAIACAKRNPGAAVTGIDTWGPEYSNFSKQKCEDNAAAEGVNNTEFRRGNAVHLDFADETFDAVTSNYVYHNIAGHNKQKLLRETLRTLKKGGVFAIHDIMSRQRYGDMGKFMDQLRQEGYEHVEMIPTDRGKFMTEKEAAVLMLKGSAILYGKK